MKGASIKPEFITTPPVEPEAEEAKPSDDEQHLSSLSKHTGWRILTEFIEDQLRMVKETNKSAIASGATFEEIGKNAIILDLAEGFVQKILDRVQDAVEACEKPDGSNK